MTRSGAEVVKVEPLGGDGMRNKLRQPATPVHGASFDFPFQLDNRGKRSIAVDLGSAAGAALAQDQGRWTSFCEAIDRPDLAADERFATPVGRYRNRAEIIGELDALFASAPLDHWAPLLDRTGVIWSPVSELPDLVDDPQARAIGMFSEVDHPDAGTFETLAAPFTMSRSQVSVKGPAPATGEHTDDILRRFGVDPAQIAELHESGVIALAS